MTIPIIVLKGLVKVWRNIPNTVGKVEKNQGVIVASSPLNPQTQNYK